MQCYGGYICLGPGSRETRCHRAAAQVGEVGENWFSVYLIPETLRVTVLGGKGRGDTVNVEIDAQTQARRAALCPARPGVSIRAAAEPDRA